MITNLPIFLVFSVNSVDPGRTPRFSASGFGQRGWPRSFSRVRWVLINSEIIHHLYNEILRSMVPDSILIL